MKIRIKNKFSGSALVSDQLPFIGTIMVLIVEHEGYVEDEEQACWKNFLKQEKM